MDLGELVGRNRNRLTSFIFALISIGLIGAHSLHLTNYSDLEMWGFVTGLWSIWWAVLNLPRNWAIGLVNEAIFFVMFWQLGLFANAFLQLVFGAVSIWGWYEWLRGGDKKTELPITYMSKVEWLLIIIGLPLLTLILIVIIQLATGTYVFSDVVTTAISLLATYLLGWRKVENWYLWFTTDIIYLFLLSSQGLYLTMALYAIFAVLCIKGFIDWRRIYKTPKNQAEVQALKNAQLRKGIW